MSPGEALKAHKAIILPKVLAVLLKDHVVELNSAGDITHIDGTYVTLWWDYDPDARGRKFAIDASGRELSGREGKFAYKDLTTDVNHELIAKTLLKQAEIRKNADEEAAKRVELRHQVEALNKEFGCDIFSDLRLEVDDEGGINLNIEHVLTLSTARQFLAALRDAGLLHATSKEHEAEVPAGYSA